MNFTLDISVESHDLYHFQQIGEIRIFTCFHGHHFDRVVSGTLEIWQGDLGNKVEVLNGLVAILHSGTLSCFQRRGRAFHDITERKVQMERMSLHDGEGREIPFVSDLHLMNFGYLITPGECRVIRFNGRKIWEFEDQFPTSVRIDLVRDISFIYFSGHTSRHLNIETGLELLDRDTVIPPSGYRKLRDGEDLKFLLRRRCTEVRFLGIRVWEGPSPLSITFKRNSEKICIQFKDQTLVFERVGDVWHSKC